MGYSGCHYQDYGSTFIILIGEVIVVKRKGKKKIHRYFFSCPCPECMSVIEDSVNIPSWDNCEF